MGRTDYQIKIRKHRDDASNPELSPKERILAARAALRISGFNDRSLRVAKRVAKQFMNDESIGLDLQLMATRLLNFCLKGVKENQESSGTEQLESKPESLPRSKMPPPGAVSKAPDSDTGIWYWLDITNQVLGIVES